MAWVSRAASATVLAGIAFSCAGAQAQGLVTIQKLSAALANELVGDAVAECARKNYIVTAAVVDLDGVRQALLRGDGAAIHTLDNAFYKAYSSASLTLGRKEESTGAVAERMAKNAPTTVPQTQSGLAGLHCVNVSHVSPTQIGAGLSVQTLSMQT